MVSLILTLGRKFPPSSAAVSVRPNFSCFLFFPSPFRALLQPLVFEDQLPVNEEGGHDSTCEDGGDGGVEDVDVLHNRKICKSESAAVGGNPSER